MTPIQPLAGVKILDFTQVMMGPSATQLLADHGADVVKVERPGSGDLSRSGLGPQAGPDNAVFSSLNRNKRSIAIDLRASEGIDVVHDLVRWADVLVHNFRPGAMERRGLGYEDVRKIDPTVIYAVGSGYGPTGPLAHKGGQDVLAQALTGVMARKADPAHPLAIYATTLADYSTGMHLVQGILLALRVRDTTGEGQRVDASLYDSMLSMQMQEVSALLMDDRELNWAAYPLTGVFETADGALVMVGAFKDEPLSAICRALEIDDLTREERFATFEAQREHRSELQAQLAQRFASRPTEHWLQRLEAEDLLCAPVQDLATALAHPQTDHNGMVLEIPRDDAPPVKATASPLRFSATPARQPSPPPRLGEHGAEILDGLGYTPERIADLRTSGVVA